MNIGIVTQWFASGAGYVSQSYRFALKKEHREGDLPRSEAAAKETLALPIYPELTDEQTRHVVDCVAWFYA